MDYDEFYRWAKSSLNLELKGYKQQQLQRRIATVMRQSGSKDLKEYAKDIDSDKEIRDKFLDYITINVTEFYRNKEIFDQFEETLIEKIAPKFNNIKIWSAACSIGAEPYTLSMILDKHNLLSRSSIIATDLDENVLERGREGAYIEREVKNISEEELSKYFTKKDGRYHIDNALKRKIEFKKHDLIVDDYSKGYHVIICRNVIIYFKKETKEQIYRQMCDALVTGGILFTGATENIYNPEEFGFKKLSTFIYEKL